MQDVLFQTAAGPVRLRWTDSGVSAIELPQITDREARAAIAKAGPSSCRRSSATRAPRSSATWPGSRRT